MPCVELKCVIAVLPDHTHLLFIGQFMRVWYISHKRTSKDQTRLHIGAVSPEPLQNRSKKKGCRCRLRPNCIGQFKKVWYLSHMRAAEFQARLHICAIARANRTKRKDVDEGSVKLYKPVKERLVLNTYASSESLKWKGCR